MNHRPVRLMAGLLALHLSASAAAAPGAAAAPEGGPSAATPKVLRYAFRIAETSFDPANILDRYSRIIASNIFEAPLEFAYMADPPQLRPATAVAMPEVQDDFRTFTFRIRSGILFAPDPVFGGRPRELTAADYVYSLKRHFDPRWKSGNLPTLEGLQILGLSELRRECLENRRPFDYDREVAGLRTLDRHTFQVRTATPNPRLLYLFADGAVLGAVAREVVEHHGDKAGEHPVGTGAFRLTAWQRSSRLVLERNPHYRDVRHDEQPPAGDARLAAAAESLRGRRLPLLDRVEVSIIDENQPRWLSFLNGDHDVLEELPPEYAPVALPHARLAPDLQRKGMAMVRYSRADVALSYFNMADPMVGGYEPHQVALRRALALGVDVQREIALARGGQAIAAQSVVAPRVSGYDPDFRSEMGQFDRARARALLDMHGYVDRNADGWRDRPDGTPLQLEYSTQPDQQSRQLMELWQKNMNALNVRITFRIAKWPENLKAARAGRLMMWGVGLTATQPDAEDFLRLGYGPQRGSFNLAQFELPAYDDLFRRQRELPDGPQRDALLEQAKKLLIAYMPYKAHVHRVFTDLAQPWVIGYHNNLYVREFWKYVDVDMAERQRRLGG